MPSVEGTSPLRHARQWLGVAVREWPRYQRVLREPGPGYMALCNLRERLDPGPGGTGWRCAWRWTSDLHAPRLMPSLGRQLAARAFGDHPLSMRDTALALDPGMSGASPEVAFIIGHRGASRIDHLLATVRSIAGQKQARIECIVVEQDAQTHARDRLPPWVRYVHTPPPTPSLPYCRSWAFNAGAHHARAPLLVLHDNDLLVPAGYAQAALEITAKGFDVMDLKRFIFYLSAAHTGQLFANAFGPADAAPEVVMQNAAGGSIVISREAYARIGGMDEAFIGWGGEDNEFWERCATLRRWDWGLLPLVHCWHAPQPGKDNAARGTTALWEAKSRIPVQERIARLRAMPSGAMSGPQGAA